MEVVWDTRFSVDAEGYREVIKGHFQTEGASPV